MIYVKMGWCKRQLFESDLMESLKLKKSVKQAGTPKPIKVKGGRERQEVGSGSMLLSSSRLEAVEEEACVVVADNASVPHAFLIGGGRVCGGGSGRRSDDELGFSSQDPNSWNGNKSADSYYQKMIEANPSNSLLANYAKFLKDVK